MPGPNPTVDAFLRRHRMVLAASLNLTSFGHHGSWVIPQQAIRPPRAGVQAGLKPDYLVGGKGSDGFPWCVVELKGVRDRVFTKSKGKVYFSGPANRGICQLLEYIDYCASIQAYLRDSLRLIDFREPKGVLVIGREREFENPEVQRLKAAWNRVTRNQISIHTYDALLRSKR